MTANWIRRLAETDEGRQILEQERLIVEVTETISALLQEQQISRSELARKIGKSPAFITKLLRGDNNFTLRTLSDIFFALDRSTHLALGAIGDDLSLCNTRLGNPLKLSDAGWKRPRENWKSSIASLGIHEVNGKDVAA